jgi:maltose alpha-D-glucosyltransferase/alpha-amylase
MLGRTRFPRIGELSYLLTLAPRGFYWFTLEQPTEERDEENDDE